MNTEQNFTPNPRKKGAIPGKPSSMACLLFALISVVGAVALPEFGFVGGVALCTSVIFMASARAFFPIMLIPFLGAAGLYVRSGYVVAGVAGVLIIASMIAGYSLNRGGFHRALMLFTFTAIAFAVGAAAFFMWYYRVSVEKLYEVYKVYSADALSTFIKAAGTRLPAEDANMLVEQYESMSRTLFLYAPVALAWIIELGGIIALRLTGLCHDVLGSIMYPRVRRVHLVNKIFVVAFFSSMLLGILDGDISGVTAANVMLVLAVPAASAGVSEIRRSIVLRRRSGKRGFPLSVLIVVLATLGLSVGVGMIVLGVIGCIPAFRKDKSAKKK